MWRRRPSPSPASSMWWTVAASRKRCDDHPHRPVFSLSVKHHCLISSCFLMSLFLTSLKQPCHPLLPCFFVYSHFTFSCFFLFLSHNPISLSFLESLFFNLFPTFYLFIFSFTVLASYICFPHHPLSLFAVCFHSQRDIFLTFFSLPLPHSDLLFSLVHPSYFISLSFYLLPCIVNRYIQHTVQECGFTVKV